VQTGALVWLVVVFVLGDVCLGFCDGDSRGDAPGFDDDDAVTVSNQESEVECMRDPGSQTPECSNGNLKGSRRGGS